MPEARVPYTTYPAVAGGSSTLSRYPCQWPATAPATLDWALGCRVGTNAPRSWIDWTSSLGANLLGYQDLAVTKAVLEHLGSGGPSWPLPHRLEAEVAERLRDLCGFPDGQVRFLKTGSEACSAAVRIARATTGRRWLLSSGYHGWHDWTQTHAPAWGVPLSAAAAVATFLYGDGVARALFPYDQGRGMAAVIVEPATTAPVDVPWLQDLRRHCTDIGALLIFDEVLTCCRYPEFVAGRHFGVQPDLYVVGKAVANGYPLAAVVGPRELMRCLDADWRPEGPTFISGTYGPETVSLAACQATLHQWEERRTAAYLHRAGQNLYNALTPAADTLCPGRVRLVGQPYRWLLEVLDEQGQADWPGRTLLLQELARRGVLVQSSFNVCGAHQLRDLETTQEAWEEALAVLADAWQQGTVLDKLEGGRVIRPPFVQR